VRFFNKLLPFGVRKTHTLRSSLVTVLECYWLQLLKPLNKGFDRSAVQIASAYEQPLTVSKSISKNISSIRNISGHLAGKALQSHEIVINWHIWLNDQIPE